MLRNLVKTQIVEHVLRPQSFDEKLGHRKYNVLILDKISLKVLSSCLSMNDVFQEGVTLVEDLTKNREPMRSMDAIYIISPSPESIQLLIDDFTEKSKFAPGNLYRSAKVFFLDPCDDELFTKLSKSPAVTYIKALKEINLSYAPLEQQVFSVDDKDVSSTATGIAALCASLQVYPTIRRYASNCARSEEICRLVDKNLKELQENEYLNIDDDSQLIVLDRSFDLVSPLLHETTLQAMAADILPNFKKGVYTYLGSSGNNQDVILDESDNVWVELRHKHIGDVLKRVSDITKEATKSQRKTKKTATIRDLGDTIRALPGNQKQVSKLAAYISLADECRERFFEQLEEIILLEQDMATGYTQGGEKLKDTPAVGRLSTLIMPAIPLETRARLILIFLLTVGKDKDEQFFNRLLHHTDLPEEEHRVVKKMLAWRNEVYTAHHQTLPPLSDEDKFSSSRWEPRLKHLLKEAGNREKLEKQFPVVGRKPTGGRSPGMASSARYGSGLAGKPREKRKMIIFIVGGMTYSEMRTVYEMSQKINTTILLGSDRLLTPTEFLNTLRTDQ